MGVGSFNFARGWKTLEERTFSELGSRSEEQAGWIASTGA
jgi:hypothetical protein